MTKDEIQQRIAELQGFLKQTEASYMKITGMIEEQTFCLSKLEQEEKKAADAANEDCPSPEPEAA